MKIFKTANVRPILHAWYGEDITTSRAAEMLNEIVVDFMGRKRNEMDKVKVVKVNQGSILFDNGAMLYSNHDQDCCENHYLDFSDLTIDDFNGLEFNLESQAFFRGVEGYGIELIPINGHPVRVPGYGYNNGYYSSNLELVVEVESKIVKSFDISDCQAIND